MERFEYNPISPDPKDQELDKAFLKKEKALKASEQTEQDLTAELNALNDKKDNSNESNNDLKKAA